MNKKVAVIGAGPAGIMAAISASDKGHNVTLFEKNDRIGKKLFITGKGRCNITNASPIEDFFNNIMSNKEFMYSSLYTYTNKDILKLLNENGLKTKVERGNRVFPQSNKSSDVINVFWKLLKERNVDIRLNSNIKIIEREKDKFKIKVNNNIYIYDNVILCTGGISYPKTGSDGEGLRLAKELGHNITPLLPSLVPIEVHDSYIKKLQGLSLRNVEITAKSNGKKIYSDFGEMVFTHYGISGPIVISMSTYLYKYLDSEINIYIDLKPALDFEKLDNRILRDFDKYNNKFVKNSLDDLLPMKLREPILNKANIDLNKPVHQITKEERKKLLDLLKGLPMTFKGFRNISEAIVTSGGIDTLEIDPSTMESKIIEGLYFAGEIIDIDALTGGYNLQIAYSTGYLAGISI